MVAFIFLPPKNGNTANNWKVVTGTLWKNKIKNSLKFTNYITESIFAWPNVKSGYRYRYFLCKTYLTIPLKLKVKWSLQRSKDKQLNYKATYNLQNSFLNKYYRKKWPSIFIKLNSPVSIFLGYLRHFVQHFWELCWSDSDSCSELAPSRRSFYCCCLQPGLRFLNISWTTNIRAKEPALIAQ